MASDTDLGMGRPIARRDFLQGAAIGVAFSGLAPELVAAAQAERAAQDAPGYDPPSRLGLRGSHPGSFEAAHALRTGDAPTTLPVDESERYDLVVVGGGISGLAAAWFYRQARPSAKILVIENHDDFGGHAKRNTFRIDGRLHLLNGGTQAIESPRPYSPVAGDLLKALGIRPKEFAEQYEDPAAYAGLKHAVFFDRETFGQDRLVPLGAVRDGKGDPAVWRAFLREAPLSDVAKASVLAIETGTTDYYPGLASDETKDRLSRISYERYLLDVVKADPGAIAYYRRRTHGLWGCGIDAVSALDCWGVDLPGFRGLGLEPGGTPRMGYTPRGYATPPHGSETFHFPDGNASIARGLVSALVPDALSSRSAEDLVTATTDYSRLDRAGSSVRIRLNHLVVGARNVAGASGQNVEIVYMQSNGSGPVRAVRASHCVLACWNMLIPFIAPELPAGQKAALHSLVKTPLVYTSVALKSWTAFKTLGIKGVHAPGGFHSETSLNPAVNIGGYRSVRAPSEPILVNMIRTPAKPGLPEREQHKAGRNELLATSFESFEREIRSQLGRMLGPGEFDPARDIAGIIVNRWPHGYAPEYNSLSDIGFDADHTPNLIARQKCGRIAIANSDAGMAAYTDVAIDQAHRAVEELLG